MEKSSSVFAKFSGFLFLLVMLALQAQLQAQTSGLWSNPATWGGSLPTAGSTVVIAPGQTVVLDVDPPSLKGIQVRGTLIFGDRDINLNTGYILVTGGELRIGTPAAPYNKKAIITFTGGTSDMTGMGLGNKFLMVMGGGKLELHGHRAEAQSWTVLRKQANPGAMVIETEDAVNWRIGDEIVIAPSGVNPEQAEKRTIVNISGHQIRLNSPLSFEHYGRKETVHGYEIDMRAEVGLLTRDIVLQGDAASESTRKGGHVMIMSGSMARVRGVEFFRMGWVSEEGRYPMHWHFSGDSYGEYASNNSIHRSFHRGFVVHGTNGVQVHNNVAFDVLSHCYVVAEDGNEEFNSFVGNLGMLIKRLANVGADVAFPGGQFGTLQSEKQPGVFWQTNPNNIVRGNRAAGTLDGIGFFYDGNGTASSVPADFFRDNIAHSNSTTEGSYDRAFYRTTGWGLFVGEGMDNGTLLEFKDFVTYKNALGGAWLDGNNVVLSNSILAQGGSGANLQMSSLRNVAIINTTPNQISNHTKNHGAINIFTSFVAGNKEPKIIDVDIIGFDKRILVETDKFDIYSYARSVNFIGGSGPRVKIERTDFKGALIDLRGELSGMGERSIYFGRNFDFLSGSCALDNPANAQRCQARDYANLKISSDPFSDGPVGTLRLTRNSTGDSEDMYESAVINHWEFGYGHRQIQWLPVNENMQVTFVNEPMPSNFTISMHGFSQSGSRLEFQVPSGRVPRIRNAEGVLIPQSSTLTALSLDTDGWHFSPSDRKLYVSVALNSAGAFEKELNVQLISTKEAQEELLGLQTVQAIPNPFQHTLNLQFEVSEEQAETSVRIMDLEGRVVYELSGQQLGIGFHNLQIDGTYFTPGHYVYELRSGNRIQTGTVMRVQE